MDRFDIEEFFHKQYRKESKETRKKARNQDQSKYKKTNQKQKQAGYTTENKARIIKLSPTIALFNGEEIECALKGSFKQERSRQKNLLAIGDIVHLEGNLITHIEPRYSILSRADNLHRRKEQLIAVNVDQVFITVSTKEPSFKPTLIDRYLIMAQKGNLSPIIVVNKSDLAPDDPLIDECEALYTSLDIPFIKVSAHDLSTLEPLKALMAGKTSVFSGQSGVGKTSLINALTNNNFRTNRIVERTQKGSHTTTHATLIPLENDAYLVDTPGIKSFGLWDITSIEPYFPEIAAKAAHCKYRGCTHTHEPDCAVQEALESGELSPLRYESYTSLLTNT